MESCDSEPIRDCVKTIFDFRKLLVLGQKKLVFGSILFI